MSATLMPEGKQSFTNSAGAPLIGGKVYTYDAGTNNPRATYQDAGSVTPNTNPIILDARGEATVFWDGNYKVILKDASDVTIWTVDNVASVGTSIDALAARFADTASAANGDAMVGMKRTAVAGAIATTLHAWHEQQVLDANAEFGMSTAGSAAANTTALNTAVAAAAVLGGGQIEIQAGTYALTPGNNFASAKVGIIGRGRVVFDYSAGAGVGFKLDAGGVGANIRSMRIENILFKGGPAITDIFYSRGIIASQFRNLQAREGLNTGFKILFAVLNTYQDCRVSNDDTAMTTTPGRYWYLDNDGTVGNHSQANTFINCDASGKGATSVSFGWTLVDATLNAWYGGTAESMNIGVEIQDDQCRLNSWYAFDVEDNVTNDFKIKGFGNAIYTSSCSSPTASPNIDISTGVNTLIVGGYMRWVNLQGTSSNTTFHGVHMEDNASLGIQGTGTYKAYGVTEGNGYATSNVQKDVLGATTLNVAFVPTQGVTPTKTLTDCEAILSGNMLYVQGNIAFTSAGTAGQPILVDFPAALASKASSVGKPVGTFIFSKAGAITSGVLKLQSQIEFSLVVNGATNLFGTSPAVTVAAGDTLAFSAVYPLQ